MKKTIFFISFFALFTTLGTFYTNCSHNNSGGSGGTDPSPSNTPTQTETLSIDVISTTQYPLVNVNYEVRLLKINSSVDTTPVYAEFVAGCTSTCPLIIIADPYFGIGWTGETQDSKWSQRANASTGYINPDEDGPSYIAGSTIGTVSYGLKSSTDVANMGGLYLPNKISILIVHNRFYLGRNLNSYVNDFVRAANASSLIKEVNSNKIGFFGASLGGFVALNSSFKATIKPKAVVIQSPLLDLAAQLTFIGQLPSLVNTNPALLLNDQKFFDSYVRRIYDFTKGPELSYSSNYDPFRADTIAPQISIPTLLLHDSWDTLIPIATSKRIVQLNPTQVFPIWYQHATPINYNTFTSDHNQASEGQNEKNSYPQYHLFFYKYLLADSDPITLYYDYIELTNLYVSFHQAQAQGQDITWLKSQLLNYCHPNLTLVDLTSSITPVTGTYYLAAIIKNIWGVDKTEQEICSYLQSASWPL